MTMTEHLHVLLPAELSEALNDFAAKHSLNRSQALRLIMGFWLGGSEPYTRPTLPNWQTEAWTALLRGLFGITHLVLTDDVRPMLEEAVATLNEREARILRLRFGLDGPRHTLADVAAIFGVNRQRVHQVEQMALARVRGWRKERGIWDLLREQLLNEEKAQ